MEPLTFEEQEAVKKAVRDRIYFLETALAAAKVEGEERAKQLAELRAEGVYALAAMTAERDARDDVIRRNQQGADSIVELCKRITSGNAVHHARNIGTIAGAIADRSARAAVEGER